MQPKQQANKRKPKVNKKAEKKKIKKNKTNKASSKRKTVIYKKSTNLRPTNNNRIAQQRVIRSERRLNREINRPTAQQLMAREITRRNNIFPRSQSTDMRQVARPGIAAQINPGVSVGSNPPPISGMLEQTDVRLSLRNEMEMNPIELQQQRSHQRISDEKNQNINLKLFDHAENNLKRSDSEQKAQQLITYLLSLLNKPEPAQSSAQTIDPHLSAEHPESQLKTSYHTYIESINYLKNLENQTQLRDQISAQTNYSRLTECPICFESYHPSQCKPMSVCTESDLHIMCSNCVQKETNLKEHSRCYICRSLVQKQQIKESTQILTWLYINKKFGFELPKTFGVIPIELHQSLRKISFFQLCQFQSYKIYKLKDKVQQSLIRYKIVNQKLRIQLKQKTDRFNEIDEKLREKQEKYQQITKEGEQIHYLAKSFTEYNEEHLWKRLDQLRTKIQPQFIAMQKIIEKSQEIFKDMIKHEKQDHEGKSLYRYTHSELYLYKTILWDSSTFVNSFPNTKCKKCEEFILKLNPQLKELNKQRQNHVKEIKNAIEKYPLHLIKMLQYFVPRSLNELDSLKQSRTVLIDSKQEEIFRQVYEQEFSSKMDINKFNQLINPKISETKRVSDQNTPIITE